MTRDEFHAIYQQGEEATFALFEDLIRRVQALEERFARNSGNSSQPPSSDGLGKAPLKPMPQSLRKKGGKKPGAQMGHTGKTLEQVATPDTVVIHRPVVCRNCQSPFLDSSSLVTDVIYSRRQVFEMPEPKVFVTEHRAVTLSCSCCGHETSAAFPEGIDQPVQYGPNLLGFAAYLHSTHLVPYARCAQIVQDVTGAPFSAGTLNRALRTAYDRLAFFEHNLKEALADASLTPVKHVDETGGRVAGKLHWFHVRCTESLCWLFRHEKRTSIALLSRGGKAAEDLHEYAGVLVSDFWSRYVSLMCEHLFCGAHLLRELTFVSDVLKQPWAASLKAELESAVEGCHAGRKRAASRLWDARTVAWRFDQWVQEGLRVNPLTSRGTPKSKARRLAERLSAYKDDYLRFLFDLTLPFTNNEAERDLRMFKVKGKISGCFRTTQGADIYCRIRSYTQTCQKQGLKLLECLRSLFAGAPVMPRLKHA